MRPLRSVLSPANPQYMLSCSLEGMANVEDQEEGALSSQLDTPIRDSRRWNCVGGVQGGGEGTGEVVDG